MMKKLDSLEKLGKFKVKLVERAGNNIVDILHKSNAWSDLDCEREDCLICNTQNSKKGSCRRRNILYETYCITCQRKHEEGEKDEKKDELDGENQLQKNPKSYSELDGENQLPENPKTEVLPEVNGLDGENQSPENPETKVVSKISSTTISSDELEGINQLQKTLKYKKINWMGKTSCQ